MREANTDIDKVLFEKKFWFAFTQVYSKIDFLSQAAFSISPVSTPRSRDRSLGHASPIRHVWVCVCTKDGKPFSLSLLVRIVRIESRIPNRPFRIFVRRISSNWSRISVRGIVTSPVTERRETQSRSHRTSYTCNSLRMASWVRSEQRYLYLRFLDNNHVDCIRSNSSLALVPDTLVTGRCNVRFEYLVYKHHFLSYLSRFLSPNTIVYFRIIVSWSGSKGSPMMFYLIEKNLLYLLLKM